MPTLTNELKSIASKFAIDLAMDTWDMCQPDYSFTPRHIPILCVGSASCHQTISVAAGLDKDGAPWVEVDGLRVEIPNGGGIYSTLFGAICQRMLAMGATAPD